MISTRRAWAALFALAVGASPLVAAPAYALTDPVRYAQTSQSDLTTPKEVRVDCPAGTRVFGVGGQVNDGNGGVVLSGIVPGPDLTFVTVTAVARSGHGTPWSLSAYAVCHNPGTLDPVRVSGAGLLWNASTSCPAGKILYGDGFAIQNATGTAYIDKVVPDATLSRLDVHASGSGIGYFNLVAHGVCAYPLYNAARTSAQSAYDATSPKTVMAPKPPIIYDYGSWIFTAGAEVTGGNGSVFLDGLGPNAALDGGWARAVSSSPEPMPGIMAMSTDADDYSVTAYATCIGSWY